MKQNFRLYALLAGANFETILYLLAGWQVSGWLTQNYPGDFNWPAICYLLALLLIGRSWYVIFRIMIKKQKSDSQDAGETRNNGDQN